MIANIPANICSRVGAPSTRSSMRADAADSVHTFYSTVMYIFPTVEGSDPRVERDVVIGYQESIRACSSWFVVFIQYASMTRVHCNKLCPTM